MNLHAFIALLIFAAGYQQALDEFGDPAMFGRINDDRQVVIYEGHPGNIAAERYEKRWRPLYVRGNDRAGDERFWRQFDR